MYFGIPFVELLAARLNAPVSSLLCLAVIGVMGVLPTHTTFGFCGPRFLVMAFPRTRILALEPCDIAPFASPHFIENCKVTWAR